MLDHAVIYEARGADPTKDRLTSNGAAGLSTIVAVAGEEAIVEEAVQRVAEGARLIELCGGVSPVWRSRVQAAVGDRARVSSVTFGIESLDAAARYSAAYARGEETRQAFLVLRPGVAAGATHSVLTPQLTPTHVIAVPTEDEAAAIAADLVDDGILLIELYGGFSSHGIASVIEAAQGRAAIGAGGFAIDDVAFD